MSVHYTTEIFDRTTGEVVALDLGRWMTLTEFTTLMGVGIREGRAVLAEIGLIHREGNRYRLGSSHERAGLGRRLRGRASRYPFDALSPSGQAYARERWAAAHAAVVHRRKSTPAIVRAGEALEAFRARRAAPMTTQMEVCWLLDHFPSLSTREIAGFLTVTEAIVFKWSAIRSRQRERPQAIKRMT